MDLSVQAPASAPREEPVADAPASAATSAPSSESSTQNDWTSLLNAPDARAKITEILSADDGFKSEVTKTIRRTDIDRRARELAATQVQEVEGRYKTDLDTLRSELETLRQEREAAKLELMTDEEKEAYTAKKEAETWKSKATNYEQVFQRLEEINARQSVESAVRSQLGFEEDDLKSLAEETNPQKYLFGLLEVAKAKREKMEKTFEERLKSIESKVSATERVETGASVVAATATGNSSGGDISRSQAESAYLSGEIPYEKFAELARKNSWN